MIGSIRGILTIKKPPYLLIDVNGVGYEIEAPMSTIYQLPDLKQEVSLLTHHVTREDASLLYGFAEDNERTLFRYLIKVNGVGAKLALTILSGLSVAAFHQCIKHGDTSTLVRLPGIGKKTAERLIIEMRDRIKHLDTGATMDKANGIPLNDAVNDAINALASLGYNQKDANTMVEKIDHEGKQSEQIIREALQGLGL